MVLELVRIILKQNWQKINNGVSENFQNLTSFKFQITTIATYMTHVCMYVCVCKRRRYKNENKERKAVTTEV